MNFLKAKKLSNHVKARLPFTTFALDIRRAINQGNARFDSSLS